MQKEIGKEVKGYSFGKPKQEKTLVDNRDYGYSQEQEFKQTRPKSPTAKITKTGKRPELFENVGNGLGPGQYETYKEFGKEVKGYGFGKPSPEKKTVDNRDYDNSPEREFSQTRHRSPAAIINKEGMRPDSFALQGQIETVGPGQYQTYNEFGQNV